MTTKTLQQLKDDAEATFVQSGNIFRTDYFCFDELVKDYFQMDYEFCCCEESRNDTTESYKNVGYGVSEKVINEFKERVRKAGELPNYSASFILGCLYLDGIIEEGDYLIDVSW